MCDAIFAVSNIQKSSLKAFTYLSGRQYVKPLLAIYMIFFCQVNVLQDLGEMESLDHAGSGFNIPPHNLSPMTYC